MARPDDRYILAVSTSARAARHQGARPSPTLVGSRVGLGLEAVAHAGLVDEVPWSGGVPFELAAQLGHVEAQVALGGLVARAPYLRQQLPLTEQLARMADQAFDEMPLRGCQTHLALASVHGAAHPPRRQVDGRVADLHGGLLVDRDRAADVGTEPGQ